MEVGGELTALEIAALQAADRGVGVVVPDHPDHGDAVFDGGAEHARVHEEGAVAADRDARTLGCRELRTEHASDAEAHGAEAHRADQGVRPLRLAILQQPVVVDPDIAGQDRLLRQRPVDLVRRALRMDRRGIAREARRDEFFPFRAIAVDRTQPSGAGGRRFGLGFAGVELAQHLPQERAHVRHQAERHGIVAGNLLGIDVDVDELGRRDREGIARQPRARGTVVEADAEGQQHVGLARRMVRLVMAVARHETQRQLVSALDGAHAARRARHRNLQPLRQAQEIGRGAAVFDALPDQDHRPLGGEQHIDGLRHTCGIGAAPAGDAGAPLLRSRRLGRRSLLEDVEGYVEHDRAGPPGHHGFPGLTHCERHHVAAGRLKHPLAVGAHGRGEVRLVMPVGLLESAAIELAGGHVAGHSQERHRIEERVGEADRHIRGARTAGGEGRGRLAGHPVVDVGHEARDRLVMHGDGLDVVRALVEGVDETDVAVAAESEDVRHLLADEVIDDDLTAVQHVFRHSGFLCFSIPSDRFLLLLIWPRGAGSPRDASTRRPRVRPRRSSPDAD